MDYGNEIPKILHSIYSDGPFDTCVDCGGSLFEPPRMYQVVKAWANGDWVFEAAICQNCGNGLRGELSEESQRNILAYVRQLTERHGPSSHGGSWKHCSFCHQSLTGAYQVAGVLLGRRLLSRPITICDDCTDPFEEQLSQQTRDAWRGFVEENFPSVPEGIDLPVFF